MNKPKSARFDLLDGLRGLVAISVMTDHISQRNGLHWMNGAWIAVDIFYVLAGFVLAYSYGHKILNGMSFRQFAIVRVVRLGPLYFMALGVGLLAAVLALQNPDLDDFDHLLAVFSLNLAWLPFFSSPPWPFGPGPDLVFQPVFPLNAPAWSMFFQLFANFLFFYYLYRFRKHVNARLVGLAVAAFVIGTLVTRQTNPGWDSSNFFMGFARVTAEFFGGTLIYSLGIYTRRFPAWCLWVVGGLLLACFAYGNSRVLFLASVTLMPATVILMFSVQIEGWLKSVCYTLGEISYPVYIMHLPFWRLGSGLVDMHGVNPALRTILFGVICVAVSLVLIKVDARIRKWLSVRLSYQKGPVVA